MISNVRYHKFSYNMHGATLRPVNQIEVSSQFFEKMCRLKILKVSVLQYSYFFNK